MFCLWNLCFVLCIAPPLSADVFALAGEGDEDVQHQSPKSGPDRVDLRSLPLSWPLSSSELLDSQGVIGEYDGLLDSTETTGFSRDDKTFIPSQPASSSTEEATADGRLTTTLEQHMLSHESTDFKSGSFSLSARTSENQSASPTPHFEMDFHSQQHFPLSGSTDEVFTEESREQTTPLVAPDHLGRTTDPSLNSQRQDTLGQTTNTVETFHNGAASKLEDTGEGHTRHLAGKMVWGNLNSMTYFPFDKQHASILLQSPVP